MESVIAVLDKQKGSTSNLFICFDVAVYCLLEEAAARAAFNRELLRQKFPEILLFVSSICCFAD